MTQTYTDPVSLKRMTNGLCPECGELPASHAQPAWKCSLTEAGVIDRLTHYRAGPTYGFETDRREVLALAKHVVETESWTHPAPITLAHEVVRLRAALDEIDELNPEDHLVPEGVSRAFQRPDMGSAFKEVCRIVNKVLHNTDAYGNPLPAQSEEKTDG